MTQISLSLPEATIVVNSILLQLLGEYRLSPVDCVRPRHSLHRGELGFFLLLIFSDVFLLHDTLLNDFTNIDTYMHTYVNTYTDMNTPLKNMSLCWFFVTSAVVYQFACLPPATKLLLYTLFCLMKQPTKDNFVKCLQVNVLILINLVRLLVTKLRMVPDAPQSRWEFVTVTIATSHYGWLAADSEFSIYRNSLIVLFRKRIHKNTVLVWIVWTKSIKSK